MWNKIIYAVLNWFVAKVFLPISQIVIDYFKVKSAEKENKEKLENLENAKTKVDIDSSFDKLP